MYNLKRIVVTGMGAITPIGQNVAEYWSNLAAGKSGARLVDRFDTSQIKCKVAAEVKGFDPLRHFDAKEVKRIERFVQFAIVTAREAFQDAGLKPGAFDPERFGCVIGSGIGGFELMEETVRAFDQKGARRVSPLFIPAMISNQAAGMASIDLGLQGPNFCTVTACAASAHAIGESAAIIARGDADAMLCGGTESAITPIVMAGFANMGALTNEVENPEASSRPFDKRRTGFLIAEGAGMLILESFEHAQQRGARIYAELAGYGLSGDAYHITAPDPNGAGGARAGRMALRTAGMNPKEVDYINAHGTATPLNDKLETQSIKTIFGERAYRIPISSNKSMIGHLLGAAGAVEAVASIKTITDGVIPPTINYQEKDPECDLDYVPNVARKAEVRAVLSFSLGFGGHNAALLFRKM
ncbi:MAG: beta-ketoacyl-ACP synthase II [Candidatus Sumerlaeota bacterium]|nr:beta-ketoacyl-ACP synthase II [Candidatus Sumerlaeota bacterium]